MVACLLKTSGKFTDNGFVKSVIRVRDQQVLKDAQTRVVPTPD